MRRGLFLCLVLVFALAPVAFAADYGPGTNATLEFVETFKIPIIKKLGLYLNLAKKDDHKQLGILKLLRFAKVKRENIK